MGNERLPSNDQRGYALVTGASSGIGAAIAREYARRGVPLVLTARRLDRLQALATELRAQVPVETIAADLAEPTAPAVLVQELERRGLAIRILVNTAGYGVPGRYLRNDWDTHARFLQLMVGTVAELTWRLLPSIRASGAGRILNVSSFAALVPASDGQTLYAPVKAWMVKFSEALALENADHGVHATVLCPGFTRSEFHDVTGTREMMSKLPSWLWLQADEVARVGIDAVEAGRVVAVPGLAYKCLRMLVWLLPDRFLLKRMARNSRRIRSIE